jgi:hypothetical protein
MDHLEAILHELIQRKTQQLKTLKVKTTSHIRDDCDDNDDYDSDREGAVEAGTPPSECDAAGNK